MACLITMGIVNLILGEPGINSGEQQILVTYCPYPGIPTKKLKMEGCGGGSKSSWQNSTVMIGLGDASLL